MARNKDGKIELTAYDELFMTDEQRAEEKLAKIRDIPLDQIDFALLKKCATSAAFSPQKRKTMFGGIQNAAV